MLGSQSTKTTFQKRDPQKFPKFGEGGESLHNIGFCDSGEHEEFWAGEFGEKCTDRNDGKERVASNLALFSEVLSGVQSIDSVLEIGSNKA